MNRMWLEGNAQFPIERASCVVRIVNCLMWMQSIFNFTHNETSRIIEWVWNWLGIFFTHSDDSGKKTKRKKFFSLNFLSPFLTFKHGMMNELMFNNPLSYFAARYYECFFQNQCLKKLFAGCLTNDKEILFLRHNNNTMRTS
jgi:hypothetical protein